MTTKYTNASAPNRQAVSARIGQPAKRMVTRPKDVRNIEQENRMSYFKCGFFLGLAIGLAIMAVVIWAWAVPTVDSCLESVRAIQGSINA